MHKLTEIGDIESDISEDREREHWVAGFALPRKEAANQREPDDDRDEDGSGSESVVGCLHQAPADCQEAETGQTEPEDVERLVGSVGFGHEP